MQKTLEALVDLEKIISDARYRLSYHGEIPDIGWLAWLEELHLLAVKAGEDYEKTIAMNYAPIEDINYFIDRRVKEAKGDIK